MSNLSHGRENRFQNQQIRIGIPSWPPAGSLLRGLRAVSEACVEEGTTAEIVSRFELGEFDCALMPTLDCLCQESCKLAPGIGVVSEGSTPTERILATQWPWKGGRITYDKHSAGLVAPAVLLLDAPAEFLRCDSSPMEAKEADGVIVTGAAPEQPHVWPHDLDVGAMWQERVGVPLVHMLWATKRGARLPELRRILARALQYADELAADETDKQKRDGFSYRIGSAEVEGLRAFLRIAVARGLCPMNTDVTFC